VARSRHHPPRHPNGNTSWLVISGGPVYQNQIALDADSLSIGTDAVIRYTLRITSSEGVANISHQGLRCDSREFKLFAIALAKIMNGKTLKPHNGDAFNPAMCHKLYLPATIYVKTADPWITPL